MSNAKYSNLIDYNNIFYVKKQFLHKFDETSRYFETDKVDT